MRSPYTFSPCGHCCNPRTCNACAQPKPASLLLAVTGFRLNPELPYCQAAECVAHQTIYTYPPACTAYNGNRLLDFSYCQKLTPSGETKDWYEFAGNPDILIGCRGGATWIAEVGYLPDVSRWLRLYVWQWVALIPYLSYVFESTEAVGEPWDCETLQEHPLDLKTDYLECCDASSAHANLRGVFQ